MKRNQASSIPYQQAKHKVAGKETFTVTIATIINVGDTDDHIMAIGSAEGTNFSTGPDHFMDGAHSVVMGFDDLIKGTGLSQGYARATKGNETTFTRYSGKTTTIVRAGGQVERTFEGTYSLINGTGEFRGIQGGGRIKATWTSEKTYVVEWEGEYEIQK